ncbi:MAG: dihydroneopterin aldolase [Leptolyngbyaceae cyanobacterium]
MDCIELTQIRCYGYTGYLPAEQTLGQWFQVDLTLWLDLAQAGETDLIDDTLDYRHVIETVRYLVQTARFALLERLAAAIAVTILTSSSQASSPAAVQQVRVRLTKVSAPIPDFGGQITVEITRRR